MHHGYNDDFRVARKINDAIWKTLYFADSRDAACLGAGKRPALNSIHRSMNRLFELNSKPWPNTGLTGARFTQFLKRRVENAKPHWAESSSSNRMTSSREYV